MATWRLDPDVTHLNHGSFGACPVAVLAHQQRLRDLMEANPVSFVLEEYQPLLERARAAVADFVHADRDGLVFVPNATYGVNSVLRSWEAVLRPGDEILVTDHAYNACRQAVEVTAARCGARIVVADVPFPVESPAQIVGTILASVSDRTALVMLDHVSSPTAVVFPIEELVAELEPEIPVLLDGAHGPGMVPVDLGALGASFYTANGHKWLCAPKGAGFLHVAERHRDRISAVSISHGRNGQWPSSGSDFHARFDWTGTDDPTARLSIAAAIDEMGAHLRGGWPALMHANHALVLEGRRIVAEAVGGDVPVPDSMIGSMAALPIPAAVADDLTVRLRHQWRIEAPAFGWGAPSKHLIRISAQTYNRLDDYERLAEALVAQLGR